MRFPSLPVRLGHDTRCVRADTHRTIPGLAGPTAASTVSVVADVPALFDLLGDDERSSLRTAMHRRRFKRGEVIFHEGDPGESLHLIDKGHVAIRTTTPLGEVATLTVLGPTETFGEGALLAPDSRRTASAVAIEGAVTLSLNHSDFDALRVRNPAIERFLTDTLAAQVRRLSSHLTEALYTPVDTRVLRRLVVLSESYGTDGGIVIPVTQEDLASMAGTTRPTANRVLKAAEADALVRVARGRIEVLDLAGLRRRARM